MKLGRWFEAHELCQFLSFEMFKCMYDALVTQPNRVSSSSVVDEPMVNDKGEKLLRSIFGF
jgi:hypothetical protein